MKRESLKRTSLLQDPKKKVALSLLLLSLLPLPVAIETRRYFGISEQDYSVLIAPPLEEEFKGALLLCCLMLFKTATWENPKTRWFLGYLIGLIFGVLEDFPSFHVTGTLLSFVTHAFWTASVGTGIYLAQTKEKGLLLAWFYFTAVAAHMAWNCGLYLTSSILSLLSMTLTLVVIPVSCLCFFRFHCWD
jgi:RsiW-degrading membrane proteinase PrsW (M82 family)